MVGHYTQTVSNHAQRKQTPGSRHLQQALGNWVGIQIGR